MKQKLTPLILAYLRFLARTAIQRHHPILIGIAGSVGKTSTRNALFAILKDQAPTQMVGNSETGIPLGILGITPSGYSLSHWLTMLVRAPFGLNYLKNTTYLIAEMGIDEPFPPKNMEYLLTILKLDIAIDLNASATHTEQFEAVLTPKQRDEMPSDEKRDYLIRKIAEEDSRIITKSGCKVGIYNADDHDLREIIPEAEPKTKLLTFGEDRENSAFYRSYGATLAGSKFDLTVNGENVSLTFPDALYPREYREVFAAVLLAAHVLHVSLPVARESLEKHFMPPKGRSGLLKGIGDSVIIDSSYNASKSAVLAFLDMTRGLKTESKRPVVFLMGDMRELGQEARQEHREVAEKIPGIADYLYLVGPQTREHVLPVIQGYESTFKEIRWFDSARRAGKYLRENLPVGAIVLVKGSQNTIFLEEAIKYILKNKEDEKKLCRQEPYWLKIKNR